MNVVTILTFFFLFKNIFWLTLYSKDIITRLINIYVIKNVSKMRLAWDLFAFLIEIRVYGSKLNIYQNKYYTILYILKIVVFS